MAIRIDDVMVTSNQVFRSQILSSIWIIVPSLNIPAFLVQEI